ncbi:MAG: hypothetical protein ACRDLP_13780 [Solirubrobacteraceae bacterium]
MDPLGSQPRGGEQRRDYERVLETREQLVRELGRQPDGPELGLG